MVRAETYLGDELVSEPTQVSNTRSSIFRAKALHNYMRGNEETVLPRFVSPRVFFYLWILLVLFLLGIGTAWNTQYSVYSSTLAVANSPSDEGLTLTVLLDPKSTVQVGEPVFLTIDGQRVGVSVMEVSPNVLSPQEIRAQLDLDPSLELLIAQPMRVALVEIHNADLPAAVYNGSFFRVDIEVDTERVIELLPVIGKYFEG
jgi:hypothetical protein